MYQSLKLFFFGFTGMLQVWLKLAFFSNVANIVKNKQEMAQMLMGSLIAIKGIMRNEERFDDLTEIKLK